MAHIFNIFRKEITPDNLDAEIKAARERMEANIKAGRHKVLPVEYSHYYDVNYKLIDPKKGK